MEPKQVIITTQYRGTYYGTLVEHQREHRWCILENARMVIRWGTKDGVDQLAKTGPTDESKLGAHASRIWIPGLTSVVDATQEAIKAWEKP